MMILQVTDNQVKKDMKIMSKSCLFDIFRDDAISCCFDDHQNIKTSSKTSSIYIKNIIKNTKNIINFASSFLQQLDFECFKKHEHEKRHEKDMIKTSSSCQIDMNIMSSTRARGVILSNI